MCDHYETRVMRFEDKSIFNSKYVSNTDHLKFVSIFSKPSRVSQELVCYKVKADQSEAKTRKAVGMFLYTVAKTHCSHYYLVCLGIKYD